MNEGREGGGAIPGTAGSARGLSSRDGVDTEFVQDAHEMDADLPNVPSDYDFVHLKIGVRIDEDMDGLDDQWEVALINVNDWDSLVDINSVRSTDDFDNDGISNIEEWLNSLVPNDRS